MKYYQLKLAELIGRFFPRRAAYGVARRLADLYFLLDRRGREAVMSNLRQIHGSGGVQLSDRALRALARENFLNFAKYVVDFFHFLHLPAERMHRLIDFANIRETFDACLKEGRGLIVVSAHLGNWELGAAAVAQCGYRINAVALWQPDPRLNALYQSYRIARQIHPIPFGRAARGCLAALRRNEIVALVGDRDYTGSRDTVEFFGRPARLPTGPARLALSTGAPLVCAFMVRQPGDTYRYVVCEPIRVNAARDTLATVMRQVANCLEQVIRQYSEQWYLFHDLWDVEEDRALAQVAAFGESAARKPVS